jgi:SAM-dependent methyltransferase
MGPQVDPAHYDFATYDTPERFISYWYQMKCVLDFRPKDVLEIGGGSGFFQDGMRRRGVSVTVVDLDARLADIQADVRALPFVDGQFDVVVAFQVLEHLPWHQFEPTLLELQRLARDALVLSLPDGGPYAKFSFRVSRYGQFRVFLPLDRLFRKNHHYDGQHYWEINRRGYAEHAVRRAIEKGGWKIILNRRLFENPGHRFYVLKAPSQPQKYTV